MKIMGFFYFLLLTFEWLWSRTQSENFCSSSLHLSSVSPPRLTPLLSVSRLATIFQFLFFFFSASLFLFVYLKSSQPVLTPCSQPSPQLFPFLSNLPLLQRLPLSQSLLSYLSLFHSWLNTFSSPSLVFPLPSNRPSFISIFHSFTVGYIFSYVSLFFSLSAVSPNLSILISIFLLFTVETSALTRETAVETNKQWGYRARWRATASPAGQGHCPSKMRCGVKLNNIIVKLKAHQSTVMYSRI